MTKPHALTIAAAQYPIHRVPDFDGWREKMAAWAEDAASRGAQLLVFPEYAALELAAALPDEVCQDIRAQLGAVADMGEAWLAHHRYLTARYDVFILAGSIPVFVDGRLHNRSWLIAPDGSAGYQDKLGRIRTEDTDWAIAGSDAITLFDTPLGRFGIMICYDAEFPYPARALVEAGADVLLVPSCTETTAGWNRVRIGCQARALENQCPVVQSVTVGAADWSPTIDLNVGAAAVYGPPDTGMPADGVLAMGTMNEPQWVVCTIDFDAFGRVRAEGAVTTRRDFPDMMRRGSIEPALVQVGT